MPTKRSSPAQPTPDPPTGRLILSGLTAFGYHGNKPAERKLGQTFTADLEVTIDTRKAAATDRIEDTISYPLLEKTARQILEGTPANLLETVAERIATCGLASARRCRISTPLPSRSPGRLTKLNRCLPA